MGKRGQKQGSIFQRKDKRWVGVIDLGWENGRRKRKSFYGKTAAEVQERLLKARSDHSRGLPVAIERQTVAQFLEHWLDHTVKPNARPRSYESFEIIIRKHITPEIGRTRLEKLTPQQVQALLDRKLKSRPRPTDCSAHPDGASDRSESGDEVVSSSPAMRQHW